jgi:hypothetical protein
MEKTKTPSKKASSGKGLNDVRRAYQQYYLENGRKPTSIVALCQYAGIKESDFYNNFTSLDSIDSSIWQGFVQGTLDQLRSDSSFSKFSSREKVLTFYFALAEQLKSDRSYILLSLDDNKRSGLLPPFMKGFMNSFQEFISQTLEEGIAEGKIARRPFLDKVYPQLFKLHIYSFLLYWKHDDSISFEKTDVYIEKSVNLAFDLIGKGVMDAVIDFGKFLYKDKVKV